MNSKKLAHLFELAAMRRAATGDFPEQLA